MREGQSIQSGIAAADGSSVDTVLVEEGTYDEEPVVDVAGLTLKAVDGAAVTVESDAGGGESVFSIEASGVTLSGFEVVSTAGGVSPNELFVAGGLDDVTIEGNTLTGAVPDEAIWLGAVGSGDVVIDGNDLTSVDTDTGTNDTGDVKLVEQPATINGLAPDDGSDVAGTIVDDNAGAQTVEVDGDKHSP